MRIVQKVGVILRDTRGAILVLEEKMNDGDYHLTIPKGTFEPEKDSSLMGAVEREIYEETGLTDYVLHTCLSCHPKYYETYISLLIVFEGRIGDDASPHANYRMKNEDIRSHFFLSKKVFFTYQPIAFTDERMYTILREAFRGETGISEFHSRVSDKSFSSFLNK